MFCYFVLTMGDFIYEEKIIYYNKLDFMCGYDASLEQLYCI